jgi:hypothetical protein
MIELALKVFLFLVCIYLVYRIVLAILGEFAYSPSGFAFMYEENFFADLALGLIVGGAGKLCSWNIVSVLGFSLVGVLLVPLFFEHFKKQVEK